MEVRNESGNANTVARDEDEMEGCAALRHASSPRHVHSSSNLTISLTSGFAERSSFSTTTSCCSPSYRSFVLVLLSIRTKLLFNLTSDYHHNISRWDTSAKPRTTEKAIYRFSDAPVTMKWLSRLSVVRYSQSGSLGQQIWPQFSVGLKIHAICAVADSVSPCITEWYIKCTSYDLMLNV
jgi:hypothetical protein